MKLLLLAIGRKHETGLALAIDTYSKRLSHYTTTSWRLVEPAKARDPASVKRAESQALLAELRAGDYVVVLDERGKELSSRALSQLLEHKQSQAVPRLVFIIGGSYGVDALVRERAQLLWSLSSLTFPHQLVRVLLVEQLYRAFTIMHGEPYHHE